MKTMGVEWELPRTLQENFVYSISENLGLSLGEQEKVRARFQFYFIFKCMLCLTLLSRL